MNRRDFFRRSAPGVVLAIAAPSMALAMTGKPQATVTEMAGGRIRIDGSTVVMDGCKTSAIEIHDGKDITISHCCVQSDGAAPGISIRGNA